VLFGLLVMAMASLGLANRFSPTRIGRVDVCDVALQRWWTSFFLARQPGAAAPVGARRHFQQRRYLEEHGYQIACVTGPALGGFMIGLQKTTMWVYVVDAAMALVNCYCIAAIRLVPSCSERKPLRSRPYWQDFGNVLNNKLILAAITLDLFGVLLEVRPRYCPSTPVISCTWDRPAWLAAGGLPREAICMAVTFVASFAAASGRPDAATGGDSVRHRDRHFWPLLIVLAIAADAGCVRCG